MNPDQELKDARQAALHEAGHFVIAEHFGMARGCVIERQRAPTETESSHVGQCKIIPHKATNFRRCAVAWAGAIAEFQEGPEDGDFFNFWDLVGVDALIHGEGISPTDHLFIKCHPQTFRAAKLAWRLLEQKRARHQEVTAALIAQGWFGEQWTD